MRVRVCVDCGEEFRPEVVRCSDCGGALEDRYDDETSPVASAMAGRPVPDLEDPLPGARPLAWSVSIHDLVPLADRLEARGLPFRIASREAPGEERPRAYELRVRDADRQDALAALADLDPRASGFTLLEAAPAPAAEGEADRRCPACGTEPPRGASECPECGLGLAGPEEPS
jgi:hypothetical protein